MLLKTFWDGGQRFHLSATGTESPSTESQACLQARLTLGQENHHNTLRPYALSGKKKN